MPQYTPPLRDMQFVMHEVLNVVDELKMLPAHADIDADTINAVLEEGGKFAAEVLAPLEIAAAGDWAKWGERSLELAALAGFRATPTGRGWVRAAEGYRAALAALLGHGGSDVVEDQAAHQLGMARRQFDGRAAAQR